MTDREKKLQQKKEFFLTMLPQAYERPGADAFAHWLDTQTDFFTAPASTKYHGAYEGGLLEHSLNVYRELRFLLDTHEIHTPQQTVAIVALLHDVCKADQYRKTETGYTYANDALPLGHGEKSLYLIQRHGLELTEEEAAAIRWHMGAYCDRDQTKTTSKAYERYPLALFLHLADMIASKYTEREAPTHGKDPNA